MKRLCVLWAGVIAVGLCAAAVAETGWSRYRVIVNDRWDAKRVGDSNLGLFSDEIQLGETDLIVGPKQFFELLKLGLIYRKISDLPRPDAWATMPRPDVPDYRFNYLTFAEMMTQYEEWRLANPSLVTRVQIGTSWNGNPIWAYRIYSGVPLESQSSSFGPIISQPKKGTIPSPKRSVVILGGTHAREWIAPATVMAITKNLIDTLKNPSDSLRPQLENNVALYVLPMVNPDGYVHTWTSYRMWRKNRRNNGGGVYGVDLNRNYSKAWGGEGSSGTPSSDTYRGPSAFSEPETTAIKNYCLTLTNIKGFIDFHSYAEKILWPWAYTTTPPPNVSVSSVPGNAMRSAMIAAGGHAYIAGMTSTTLYISSGSSKDYIFDLYGCSAYTIELRDTGQNGFILPESEIIPTQNEGWAAMRQYLSDMSVL